MADSLPSTKGQAGPKSAPHLAPARRISRQDAAVTMGPETSAEASEGPRMGAQHTAASPATPAAAERPASEPGRQPVPPATPARQTQPRPVLQPVQPAAPAGAATPASFAEYCNALRAPLDFRTAAVTAAMGTWALCRFRHELQPSYWLYYRSGTGYPAHRRRAASWVGPGVPALAPSCSCPAACMHAA